MRKSLVFPLLIAPFLFSVPAGAAPLHVRAATAIVSASADAGSPECSLEGLTARSENRPTSSWSNALGDSKTLKLFRADGRFVEPSKGEATAQLQLPPELASVDYRWSSVDTSQRENANANAAVNHLFAPPNGMSLFVTQTNNEGLRGASQSNATLAAVQLRIR